MNPFTLEKSIPRAVKMLQNMMDPKYISADKAIPLTLVRHCEGVAFIRIYKAGLFMLGGNIGGGCVIAKIKDPNEPSGYRWSAPVAVVCGGLGGGFVFGGEQIDSMILLNTRSAIRAFTGKGQVTFGGNVSLAVGPVGRDIEAHAGVSDNKEILAAYSYSQAKGAYIGGTLEGAILIVKDEENKKFYENPNATAEALVSGTVLPPFRAQALGNELEMVINRKGPYAKIKSDTSMSDDKTALAASGRDLVKKGFSSSALGGDDLADGWEQATAPDGKIYYYNVETQKTQWDKPLKPVAVAVAVPPPPPPQPSMPMPSSRPGAGPAPARPGATPFAQPAYTRPGAAPTPVTARPEIPSRPVIPSRPSVPTAVALYEYTAVQPDELSIKVGDRIEILEKVDANWWKGRCNGRVGLVPATYLKQ